MKTNRYLDSEILIQMNQEILKEDVRLFAEQFELRDQLRGKSFLITGATGLIGSVLIRCLHSLNEMYNLDIRMIAVVRNLEKAKSIFGETMNDIQILQLPLTDVKPDNVHGDVDYIVHLASPTAGSYMEQHPLETFNLAYQSTYNLLNFAHNKNSEGFVYISSLEYYGQIFEDKIISENVQGYVDPVSTRSSYPMGKRAAEYLCFAFAKEFGTPAKVARLTQTLGAGVSENDNRVFAQFARSVIKGEDIILHTKGESAKPYCYTTDCISAILYILLNGEKGEAYNVANTDTYISIRNLAEYMKEQFAPSISVRIVQTDGLGYAPVTKLRLSTEKLEALGWKPQVGKREMFDRLIKFIC